MVAFWSKSAVVLAAFAAATVGGQDGSIPAPAQPASTLSNPALAATIAQWKALQQTDALPFDSYASFLLAHPGWPGEADRRRAAERKAGEAAPANAIAFFARFPPTTAVGAVAHARALQLSGRTAEATAAARRAWRYASLSAADEASLRTGFPVAFTAEDHDARMDALLWAGATSAAQRQLAWVSPARRGAFAARLSLRTNAPDAATLATDPASPYASDAGYIADRATWLRNNNASPSARTWLARPRTLTTRPGNVEEWYEVLLTHARAAAADGQWQLAYDIARQIDDAYPAGTDVAARPYGERDDYTSLAWLGGTVALQRLNRPADAMALFDRYGRASRAPQTRSKGLYWAGRGAEGAGRSTEAASFLAAAAAHRDQFYGQLAAERSGRPLASPPAYAPRPVDAAVRARFNARETVQAARFLGQIDARADQTLFLRQIAADATSDADHVLATELSRSLGRPDLAVMIGRSALQNGLGDYSTAGFPTISVPAEHQGQWTMVHAIARQESQFDRAAVSRAGARGLMQLMPGTAREQAGKIGASYDVDALTRDTDANIRLGASYFQRVYNIYNSYPLALAAYNAGPGNVNKWLRANGDPRTGAIEWVDWIERIPLSETRGYVQRVLENAVVYDLVRPQGAISRGPANLSWYLGKSRPG